MDVDTNALAVVVERCYPACGSSPLPTASTLEPGASPSGLALSTATQEDRSGLPAGGSGPLVSHTQYLPSCHALGRQKSFDSFFPQLIATTPTLLVATTLA